ncbi:hypothetical protein ACLOJK_019038, partial [Asimina triloba]
LMGIGDVSWKRSESGMFIGGRERGLSGTPPPHVSHCHQSSHRVSKNDLFS